MRGEARDREARGRGMALAQQRLAERGRGLQRIGSGGEGSMRVLRKKVLGGIGRASNALQTSCPCQ